MHCSGLVRLRSPFFRAIACSRSRAGRCSAITSRILIDPAGEHTGDEFGTRSRGRRRDGDGYDDLLIEVPLPGDRQCRRRILLRRAAIDSVATSSLTVRLRPNNDTAALNAGDLRLVRRAAFDTTRSHALRLAGNQHLMNAAKAGDVNADAFSDLIGAGKDQCASSSAARLPTRSGPHCRAHYASVAGAGTISWTDAPALQRLPRHEERRLPWAYKQSARLAHAASSATDSETPRSARCSSTGHSRRRLRGIRFPGRTLAGSRIQPPLS